jgi:hypothetical protein
MTLLTVSNQGFTVHNHRCGINFLSHFWGAPQNSTPIWDALGWNWDEDGGVGGAKIADIARHRRNRKSKTSPRMNTE